jgi:hypothetical protein
VNIMSRFQRSDEVIVVKKDSEMYGWRGEIRYCGQTDEGQPAYLVRVQDPRPGWKNWTHRTAFLEEDLETLAAS